VISFAVFLIYRAKEIQQET